MAREESFPLEICRSAVVVNVRFFKLDRMLFSSAMDKPREDKANH